MSGDDVELTVSSTVDIPATYCPKCNSLLPEGTGEISCITCSSKVNVKQPSLIQDWENERIACPSCSKVLIAGLGKRPCKLQCSSCNQNLLLRRKL